MKFAYFVVVDTDTPEHADQVMAERLDHDEDYGFEYSVAWDGRPEFNEEST